MIALGGHNGEWIAPGSRTEVPPFSGVDGFLSALGPTIAAVASVIEEHRIDACLAQAGFYSGWIVLAAARAAGVPVAHLYCGSSQAEIADPSVRAAYRPIECGLAEFANATWFNSRFGKRVVEEMLDREFPSSPVIYNGVSEESTRVPPWSSDVVVVGWTGRNAWVKNVSYLWDLRRSLPRSVEMHLMTTPAGDAPLGRASQGMHIDDPVPPQEIGEFLGRVSCVLNMSYVDFFPTIMVEAIAAGRVPIVSRTTGTAELLVDAALGELVVDTADVRAVCERILDSSAFADRIREFGAWLRVEHSWHRVVERYFAALDELR
jgi:glycosyltransferase involved in cell wall biosynthesis